jgi:hypothetical protein
MRRRPHSLRDNSTDSNRTGLSSPILVLAGLKRVVGLHPLAAVLLGMRGMRGRAGNMRQTMDRQQSYTSYCTAPSGQNSAL